MSNKFKPGDYVRLKPKIKIGCDCESCMEDFNAANSCVCAVKSIERGMYKLWSYKGNNGKGGYWYVTEDNIKLLKNYDPEKDEERIMFLLSKIGGGN